MEFDLNTYLKRLQSDVVPHEGMLPSKEIWTDFCQFDLVGSRLCFSDVFCPVDGVAIPLPSGLYQLKLQIFTYGCFLHVAALRAQLIGTTGVVDQELGQIAVDGGRVGVTDLDDIEALDDETYEAWISLYCDQYDKPRAGIHADANGGHKMPFIDSGWGDGVYSVYMLENDGGPVGGEVRFIASNEPYPFPYANAKNEYDIALKEAKSTFP